jgi:hypothetical protein
MYKIFTLISQHNFVSVSDYSVQQLEEFCNLARSEFGIDTFDEAIEFFESKYEWNIMSRKDELEKAWYSAANVVSNREDKVMERVSDLVNHRY